MNTQSVKSYFKNYLVLFTHALNVVFNGKASEDFSSRCYRCKDQWFFRYSLKAVDLLFGEGHCYAAYLQELEAKPAWERH